MSRWECSGRDWWLFAGMTTATIAMFFGYLWYARQNKKALSVVKEEHFRDHHQKLMAVFVLCAFIHVINSVLTWWVTAYWIGVLLTAVNSYMTWQLCRSKSQVLAIQTIVKGDEAVTQVKNALYYIEQKERQDLHDDLCRIETILRASYSRRSVSDVRDGGSGG